VVQRRLDKAAEETNAAFELGAIAVVNDELERCVDDILRIIEQRRAAEEPRV